MNYHLDEIEQIQSFAKSLPAGHKGLSREDRHIVRDWVRSRLALESTDDAGNPQEQFAYFQTFLGLAKQARWKSLTAYALSEWGRRTKNMYGAIYSSGYEAGHEMANFHVRRQGKEKASVARTKRAKAAAEALHGKPGGSRWKANEIRSLWATGKFSSRDECAEQEWEALGMSPSSARRALRNTPDPQR